MEEGLKQRSRIKEVTFVKMLQFFFCKTISSVLSWWWFLHRIPKLVVFQVIEFQTGLTCRISCLPFFLYRFLRKIHSFCEFLLLDSIRVIIELRLFLLLWQNLKWQKCLFANVIPFFFKGYLLPFVKAFCELWISKLQNWIYSTLTTSGFFEL